MTSLAAKPVLANTVECTDDEIIVSLSDGRSPVSSYRLVSPLS